MNTYIFPIMTDGANLPFCLKGVGGLINQGHIVRTNGYHDFQWLQCVSGRGMLLIDGKEFILAKNSGFLLTPGIPHEYYSIEEPFGTRFISFNGSGVSSLIDSFGFGSYHFLNFEDIRLLDRIIQEIFIISQSKGIMVGHRCSEKIYNLLIELKTLSNESENKDVVLNLKKLQPVLEFMESNYMKNISIEDMAKVIQVSPQYLCRIFSRVLNTRPFTYLNLIKLRHAKKMLLSDYAIAISAIAAEV